MIIIPRKIVMKKNKYAKEYRHYELIEEKCTKTLAVYKCIETGHLESFQKRDFMKKEDVREKKAKYE